ncbi:hypothetical protein CHISP_2573 [Chitinispirillum alkaliphilum]|nr:hypothetical protein CHISP_2573 [Chitinispirillum alkaliphilum]
MTCKTMSILIAAAILTTQASDLQFGGYLQNRTTLTLADEEIFSDLSQVRLEGRWDYDRGGIETNIILSAGFKPLDPFETIREGSVMDRALQELMLPLIETIGELTAETDTLAAANEELMMLMSDLNLEHIIRFLPYSSFYPSERTMLDRALVKMYFDRFDLFVGRQMIAWGTGYAFNPTDIWNRKNPLDPDAPRSGVNALRAEIPFGVLSGLSLVATPGRNFEYSSGGFRLKTNAAGFDMSISGMSVMNADRALLGLPRKIMAGADLAGQIGEIGVWAEVAANNPLYEGIEYTDFDSLYLQADFGLDYTFINGLYMILEYYYNGLGRTDPEDYGARELLYLLSGEMAGFARHYLFGGFTYDINTKYFLSAFALGNLVDGSVMLLPSIGYDMSDNITVELGAQIGVGDKETSEYGGMFPNLLLTVTGYF